MKYKKIIIYFLVLLILIIVSLFVFRILENNSTYNNFEDQNIIVDIDNNNLNNNDVIVGGDRDEHGCIGSAGYSYCIVLDKCIRPWEEECKEKSPSKIVLEENSKRVSCEDFNGEWYEDSQVCEINSFSESTCVTKGGEFNPCASACRHDPKAEMCTLQCVLTCSFK